MGSPVSIRISANVTDGQGAVATLLDKLLTFALTSALGQGDRRQVSVSAASFQAFTVPTNATYCLIVIPAGSESLFLKAATGDATGIALTNATAANVPEMVVMVPVDGTSPAIGVLNSGDAAVVLTVIFL